MTAALRRPMTAEEFLVWEERHEIKHEFDGSWPMAMTGGTMAHALIAGNLATSLNNRLRGGPCRFYGSDAKVETVRDGKYRYPDGSVSCAPVPPRDRFLRDPVVIFEVLSASTSSVDRITKNREYSLMSSVRRYVMLEQDRIGATMFERVGEDWVGHVLADGDTLAMPEIDVRLPLAELYEGVEFSEEPE